MTHSHPDAICGAQATALAIRLARRDVSKENIRFKISESFDYDLSESVAKICDYYEFDVTCSVTVPPAIVCALEADSYEEAVRNAVSLGGDSDTLACIAGSIAEALFGIPGEIGNRAMGYLGSNLQDVVFRFHAKYMNTSESTG